MTIQLHNTPPESFTRVPLTPPATGERSKRSVLRILKEFKSRKAGNAPKSFWSKYLLEPEEYKNLLHRLQSDSDKSLCGFVEDKVRFDYFPSTSTFVLRMVTLIHEVVIANIFSEFQSQLQSISNQDNQSAKFAQKINSRGSGAIELGESQLGRHQPDGQWSHVEAQYPGVVLEVAYSQKAKDLARLADEYILESKGDIRVVIGIKLEYKKPNEATLSVWEPRIVPNNAGEYELVAMQVVANERLRDQEGNINQSANINLQLQQFGTEAFIPTYGILQDPIFIPAQKLCGFIDSAIEQATLTRRKVGLTRTSTPWIRTRPRDRTPDEELEEQDGESKERDDEEEIEDETKGDDSSYHTDSSVETN